MGSPVDPESAFTSIELPAGNWDLSQLYKTGRLNLIASYRLDGDFNVDGHWDEDDIDRLAIAVRAGKEFSYDLNYDRVLDQQDRLFWVHEIKQSYFGDANLDREFNSADLVAVFRAGQYEDGMSMNSGWTEGDWNGDGDFNSGDLVFAFQDGGYEQGPRSAIQAVPEPTSLVTIFTGLATVLVANRGCRTLALRRS